MKSLQKKWHFCCCLLLILSFFKVQAQINITGRVVDENSNIALAGASIYFNNTTIGAYTDTQGYFFFENIRLINTDLVISFPGYDLLIYRPVARQVEGKKIIFKLHPKARDSISRLNLTSAIRKTCLDIFSKIFLGFTREASKCEIINESAIYFGPGKSNTGFRAYADTPLVILNTMLGYKINFNLEEFWYDDESGENYLVGYTRYDEIEDNKKYAKNRRDCYYGSTLHFYRSLISNQLYEQGFGAFLLQKVTDTSTYWQRLNPEMPAIDKVKAEPVSAQQILFIDSTNNFSIRAAGELLVQYNKNPASKDFLNQTLPVMEGKLEKGVESTIVFKVPAVQLNYSGVLDDDTAVEYSGYWTYEKLATSLPFNYQVE